MLHEALGEAKQILTDEQLERFVEIIREDAVWYDFFYTELTTGLRRGEPTHPSTAYDRLKALLKRAELPDIRFHGLHHTFATHALASGVDVKTLSGILGHTRSAFAQDTYPHHYGYTKAGG